MRYEGDIYRPPSEAYSLLIQVTIGCSHNKCTFCSMFKDKMFRVREVSEVMEDLETARKTYRKVERIFLCDGDALCLSNDKLLVILDRIRELFPECKRVSVYGSAKDVLRKTPAELKTLRDHGMGMIYLGAESGSQKVLDMICKGVSREEMIEAVCKIEDAGIPASVTFISGLAGKEAWEEHAVETGKMISEMNASYVSLLTLMLDNRAPIVGQINRGELTLLSAEEVVAEAYLLLKHANPTKPCVFRSNHASNYVSLRGNLPADKPRLMEQLERAMADTGLLKDERFRML
ncbi:radical SAM protein [Anaerotruncus sp. 80]|uniref:Radical SAM protein n=1 Tax=Anaerotruncus colihominis TaxID=169435 RepID=A0A845QHJ4_9FIRM|nr:MULTISPECIES: radical SAM protein [Clostridia]MCI9638526.1 radical SAM protein [Emergencia sp.]NBH60203.1 radical SAM protein [Anaerotruncus colihominis]NCF00134.1 radical SAM protein [Emergencia sp. 1XD21-10]NCF00857.1 radical SAM protein [Anaerotruncus sp. 80]